MSGGALALALGAAVLHATWNVLLAGARNTAAATGGLIVWGVALLAIPAVLVADVSTSAIPFILASAALELAYFLLLARAYDTGELSVVYPVARGVAPALVLVVGVTTGLGERVGVLGAVGVLCIVGGVLLVSGTVLDWAAEVLRAGQLRGTWGSAWPSRRRSRPTRWWTPRAFSGPRR